MHGFAFVAPTAQAEVTGLLEEHGSEARLLAGGTDLVVGLRTGAIRPRVVVDLKRVAELRPGLSDAGGRLAISATTPLSRVVRDGRVRQWFPALAEAAATVGSIQIRNRATLAGNICNASPAADTVPALLVYGAEVVIAGRAGERRLPLDRFLLGPRRTALGRDELVTSIELARPGAGTFAAFGRLTRRRGVDLATISVCCSVDAAGVTRFAFGAVAPTPFLVADESGVLADPDADPETKDRVLAELTGLARPISDVRGSREYRQAMLMVVSRRLLRSVVDGRGKG